MTFHVSKINNVLFNVGVRPFQLRVHLRWTGELMFLFGRYNISQLNDKVGVLFGTGLGAELMVFFNGNYAQRVNLNFNFVFCRKPRPYLSFQSQSISRFLQLMSGRTWQFSNLQVCSARTVVSLLGFALIKTRFVYIPFLIYQRYYHL